MENVLVTVDFFSLVIGVLFLGFMLGLLVAYIMCDYMRK